MANLQTNVPSLDVPFVDGNGYVTEAWLLFLIQLFRRTGGTTPGGGQISINDVLAIEALSAPYVLTQDELSETTAAPIQNDQAMLDMIFSPAANTDFTQAARSVTLPTSPATYTATYRQGFHIDGGTVTSLSLQRGATVLPIGNAASDIVDKTFVAGTDFTPGTTATLTLPDAFGSVSRLWVFFDPLFQGDDQISSLVGTTLTFTSPIPIGTGKVYVKGLLQSSIGIGSTLIELNAGDSVNVTYSSPPTVTILPR